MVSEIYKSESVREGFKMLAINGIDYIFYIIGIIVALLFAVQYIICCKAKRIGVKLIPVYGICLLIIWAILVAVSDNSGSLIDLKWAVVVMILGVALICSISVGAAWAIYKIRKKSKSQSQR